MTGFRRLNDRLAALITRGVGTMACAWLFTALAMVSLPSVIATGSVVDIVGWIAQTFLQLVLLSVILVGQRLADERHQDRHDQTMARLDKVHHHLGIKP